MRWVRHAAGLAAVIGDALMFCIANCDRFSVDDGFCMTHASHSDARSIVVHL